MVLRSRPVAALLALLLALALLPAAVVALGGRAGATPAARALTPRQVAGAEVARARVPRIDWAKCPRELTSSPRASCATVRVPLDYHHPRGATTPIALTRVKAGTRTLGTLFVNPGGPGGAAGPFALVAGRLLGQRVDRYFDVIGIDPRGTGGSGSTVCRGQAPGSVYPPVPYPIGAAQVAATIRADDNLRQLCRHGASPLVDHASTADDARDMDLVRRALEEAKLTYYGISYGTYLGATYAALFPTHIRAMVVDGVLDPVAWSTGRADRPATEPFTTRVKSGQGAFETLTSAFTECDRVGPRHCSLAPDSESVFRTLFHEASVGDLTVGGDVVHPQDLVGIGLSSLYDARDIRSYFQLLHYFNRVSVLARGSAARVTDTAAVRLYHRLSALHDRRMRAGLYAWRPAQSAAPAARAAAFADVIFQTVGCGDSRNPRDPGAWERAAHVADQATPWFGRLWTWSSSSCARTGIGSHRDAFFGPWRTHTSYPLLVVGNVHDPATPVSGARRVNSLFDGSVLLLYNGWGHGALATGRCIRTKMGDYLVHRVLPRPGTVCEPARELFNAHLSTG